MAHWQLKTISVLLEDFVNHINDGVFITSVQGQYLYANKRLVQIYGFASSEELIHHFTNIGDQLYVDKNSRPQFTKLLKENNRVDHFESQVRRKNGSVIWIRETAWMHGEDYIGTVTDITAEHSYYHDDLTGLPRRFLFEKNLQEKLDQNTKELGLILLEIQDFIDSKNIEGELTIQAMISAMAKFLKEQIGPEVTLARIEQHQFVFLYPEATPVKTKNLISKIQKLKNLKFTFEHSQYSFNEFCLGLLVDPVEQKLDAKQSLSRVQLACREAKNNPGEQSYAKFEQQMETKYREKADLTFNFTQALDHRNEKNEFSLMFQPQFNLRTKEMIGGETLLRWHIAKGEFVSPVVFIPMAEELGRIHELGYFVMETAFPILRNWQKQRLSWKNSINLSIAQFFQEDFKGNVLDILDKTKVDPKDLIFEITESGDIPDSKIEKLNQILDVFRELGIKISHDDFGAGNSIDHLLRLRIDELKMDKSFWNSPHANKLLKMVATLSQDLGVRLVVEGVETKEQVEILMRLDIDVIVQGYYFSKPLSLQELENTYGKLQ